jgi:chromosome segregation protein
MGELDRRLQQIAEDIDRERRLADDAASALARLAAEETSLLQETGAMEAQRASAVGRVSEVEVALSGSEKALDALTGSLADLAARRNALDSTLREHTDRLDRIGEEIVRVERELNEASAAQHADLGALAAAAATAQASLADAEVAAIRAEASHSGARQALEVARAPLADAEKRAQRLETEARTLARLLHIDTKNLWPAVIDDLTVEKGFEAALGAALGDDLEAPVDPSAPMRWAGAEIDPADPVLPSGVEALADHVHAPRELARRLRQIGLVTREQAVLLVPMLRAGQRVVSREGDLWRWDGFSVAANAPTGAARRLAGKNRLSDIEAELEAARRDIGERQLVVAAAEAELASSAEADTAARNSWRMLQREADSARNRCAEAEREASRKAARLSALTEAVTRLTTSRDELAAARGEVERALISLPPSADAEARLAAVRAAVERERAELAEARAQSQALARQADIARERLVVIRSDRERWSGRHDGTAAQIKTLTARADEAKAERASLEDAPQHFEEKRRRLLDEIEAAEAARRTSADRLAEGENGLAEADRAARAALEAMSAAREQSARAEERCEGAMRRLADVTHEIHEMLEVEPVEVAALAGIASGKELPQVADVEASLERLRRERERLGAVNLRAEAELHEVETQHGSLTKERDDLVEAIKRLRQGIQNLNREARERLLSSFELVNTHFKHLFTELFGGGNAELQLVESDDPLEAGLEIVAKPPGKKPATLSLLSGGEQALTALALIFAVFLTNPAPICVLDEVDAPLDDHNIERFCDLLDEMTGSTDTRFVIITHNPITMARMSRLYGVTMAERGVSQLVSVDLEGAVKLREAV